MSSKSHRDSLVTPLYDIPDNPGNPGAILMKSIGGGLCFLLVLFWICTQYLAHRFGYQDSLGAPLFALGGFKLYSPIEWFGWYAKWRNFQNPAVQTYLSQVLWVSILGFFSGLGLVMYMTNKVMARMDTSNEHIHGSAHWASPEEVERTGLLG